jgi:type IV pilus assembly protein PilQ
MHLGFRLTVLGMFTAAGLSLAVALALPDSAAPEPITEAKHGTVEAVIATTPVAASGAPSVPPEAADRKLVAEPPDAIAPATPLPPDPPSPTARPLELHHAETQALIDQAFQRWTATHWPPVTRQFDMLDQALKAVQKLEQATQDAQAARRAEVTEPPNDAPARREAPPPVPAPLPAPAETLRSDTAQPEIQINPGRDLVSIHALGSDIREVLKALSEAAAVNILASPNVTGTVSLSLTDVEVETALNAILKSTGYRSRREGNFLFVGTVEELQKMAVAGDQVGTRVYRPNYATAAELQKLITTMLSPEVGVISISTAPEVGIASNKDQAGGMAFAGSEVVVVRDYESVLRHIDQVYEEIDQMPTQVIIEAMILSVRLDDQDTLGVDFELLRNKDNIRIVSGTPLSSLANLDFDGGLKVGFLDESMFALVQALETIGDTHVIASPRVMCLNKQRAEILIGAELGYISTTVTETAATQSVEFLEVGTHLKIRPFISSDGMVRLEVHPELSTGTVRVQGGFTLPDKDVTQVTTNVMCRSGATVVIGGLIREDLITSAQQIPVLGNLPLVGALFRQRTEDTERREIIVLLTPRIVDESEMLAEGQKELTETRDRRNAFFDKMQPINKRRVADRYGRLALSAWTAGDASTALRFANLAIHWDPLHQDAVNLRQQIIAAYPHLEPHVINNLKFGLNPLHHPVRDYSPVTGWPWRAVGPAPQYLSAPLYDSGQPGPVRYVISDE